MSSAMLRGGCLCGAIRYETDGRPFEETNCHCSACRKSAGAPYIAWFTVRVVTFRFVAGKPVAYRSSDHGTRQFCGRCGTQLTFSTSRLPGEIDVTIASLDDPSAVPPKAHGFAGERLSWLSIEDGLPRHEGDPPPVPDVP